MTGKEAIQCKSINNSGEVYSIQHFVIKFVCDLWQVSSFFQILLFPPPIKLIATVSYFESGVKHHNTDPRLYAQLLHFISENIMTWYLSEKLKERVKDIYFMAKQ
jgi:hypothetical protein